ncbi:hypothetical protein RI367_001936 [Sorochytrium milnesiophthora]
MVGVFLQKLPGYGADAMDPTQLEALFHMLTLKLALTMHHPRDRRRWRKLRLLGKVWHTEDMSSLYFFRQEEDAASGATASASGGSGGGSPGTGSAPGDDKRARTMPRKRRSSTLGLSDLSLRSTAGPGEADDDGSDVQMARGRHRSASYSAPDTSASASSLFGAAAKHRPRNKSRNRLLELIGWGVSPSREDDSWLGAAGNTSPGHENGQAPKSELDVDDVLEGIEGVDAQNGESDNDPDDDDYLDPYDGGVQDLGNQLYWQLDDIIGQGAVGMVYRAFLIPPAPHPPIVVATKYMNFPAANPHLNRHNFQRLAAALSLAIHPNVVSYYGCHAVGEDGFLFMEYCNGGSLAEYVKKHGPVKDLALIKRWTRMLVDGLYYLHKHGIVHRDVKTSNVLLKDGVLKIVDFSAAKIQGVCCQRIHDSRVVGTPAYIAPETVVGGQVSEITGAQDIWSLGTVLYELLMGKPPFSEIDNVWSLYFVIGQYATLNTRSKEQPSRFKRFLAKAQARTAPVLADIKPGRGRPSISSESSAPTSAAAAVTAPPASEQPTVSPYAEAARNSTAASVAESRRSSKIATQTTVNSTFSFGDALNAGNLQRKPYYHYARRQSMPVLTSPGFGADISAMSTIHGSDGDESFDSNVSPGGYTSSTGPSPRAEYPESILSVSDMDSSRSYLDDLEERSADGDHDAPTSSAAPEHPTEPTGYITGTDQNGYPIYKFMEPLYPMQRNHHPLLSQVCQTGVVDPLVLDFLEKCLVWDPRRRATARSLLRHPLIRDVIL